MSRAGRHLMALIAGLLLLIILPFVFWGERFEAALSLEGSRAWMEKFNEWAWLAGVGLLVADIALPIPGTVVMSAMGWKYGWFWGGCISALGSVLSGVLAYGLCRTLGRAVAVKIAGEESLMQAQVWFEKSGGWLVAMSRWMPVLPEAVACLAGLARMRWRTFWVALLCGSLPLGFACAAIGDLGHESPAAALTLSAVVPIGMWWLARRWRSVQSPK